MTVPEIPRDTPPEAPVAGSGSPAAREAWVDRPLSAHPLREALVGYAAFCGLSALSRVVPAVLLLVVVTGIGGPLLRARRLADRPLGYRRRELGVSLAWGVGIGAVVGGLAWLLYRPAATQELLGIQLALGVPLWLLVMSPFQENLFRGWLQPLLERALGRLGGLVATTLAFAAWHLFPPLEGTATSSLPVSTPAGLAVTVLLGLLTGLALQRTRSLVGPWLGHALAGLALVLTGQVTYLQYTE